MTANSFTFRATGLDDTDRFGAALAELFPDGTTVCLSGTLGAGKTRLVQAIAAACGINRADVVSPTFVLCQHYSATRRFNHLDAYRIRDDDEFLELGVDEMFASDGITLVEWGERV
ncbi:MAG TPA: tRNA (adenosine(37)-N6)-threonylcarbamoyltransferase complex ATPase subunit type 1 TsaE, partial [Pirellulaceae bacterium]|nr:tRNA (adenosine(37)-N6)-threonylcarbamoyltransferase complex ATPase subunit type 1 TsaE [Pirellulaceae bacterium]